MRKLAIVLLLMALPLTAARAEGLTLRDIVELHKAGISEDVLVALIESNQRIYTLEPGTLKTLKSDGLTDRVLIAIINSGRKNLPPPAPVAPVEPELAAAPTPVVIIEHQPASAPQVVVQQVPVYVPVAVQPARQRKVHVEPSAPTSGSPYYHGQVPVRAPQKAPEPVYWGFGGKLRPDAWQPSAPPKKEPDDKKPDSRDRRGRGGR